MTGNFFSYMFTLFSGMLLSLLAIYLNDIIKKRDRPEKYQEKIYEQRLIVYKILSSSLFKFTHNLVLYSSQKIDDKTLYKSRIELMNCLCENVIFFSDSLIEALAPIMHFEQPKSDKINKESVKEIIKNTSNAMAIMKKELGFLTINSRFDEIFPELTAKWVDKDKKM